MGAQRERILRATLRCIGELGIELTSVLAIRKEAGLSAGSLYTHFANKDAIIAEALRFGSVKASYLPLTWPELVTAIASMDDANIFDFTVAARVQLQIFAAAIRPGSQHDLLKPIIQDGLEIFVNHLRKMQDTGKVKFRVSPLQTALAIGAIRDGIFWSGLALDRSPDDIRADIFVSLSCLVYDWL